MKLKRVFVCFLALLVIFIGAMSMQANPTTDELVATVNGVDITVEEFFQALEEQGGAIVLERLIRNILMVQKQEELGIDVDEDLLEHQWVMILIQLGGEPGLKQFLEQTGLTEDLFREELRANHILTSIAKRLAYDKITDEEIEEYFNENRDSFFIEEQVEARHILVETEELANTILEALKNGESFEELSKEHSLDPVAGPKGGYLGFFSRGKMIVEFEEAAFNTAPGEYVLVETHLGWHIIHILEKIEARDAELSEVYDKIKDTLAEEQKMPTNELIMHLFEEADIQIHREGYVPTNN